MVRPIGMSFCTGGSWVLLLGTPSTSAMPASETCIRLFTLLSFERHVKNNLASVLLSAALRNSK